MESPEATAKRLVQKWESEQHFLEITPVQFTRLENYVAAALAEAHHCKDCCCARSWGALGILDSKGMSIPEHIEELKAERDAAFVKGLQRAKDVICYLWDLTDQDCQYAAKAIQAEIDKATR